MYGNKIMFLYAIDEKKVSKIVKILGSLMDASTLII